MKKAILEKLKDARNFSALTACVLQLCESYGPVHSFRFVHNKRARRVACFVELDSPKQQQAMALGLGATMLIGQVCLEIPVRPDIDGNREDQAESRCGDTGALLSMRGQVRRDTAVDSMYRDCVSHAV